MEGRTAYGIAFGANLAVLRKLAGYGSQGELAAALNGPHVATIGRWERGEQLPDAYELALLAELLGATPSELLEPRELTAVERALLRRGSAALDRARQGE